MVTALLVGFLFGFVGSMPVAGPIAVLVLDRGLQNRTRSGIYLAVGSAISESVYAYLAFWAFTALVSQDPFAALLPQYPWAEPVSRGLAAVIPTALGLRFMLAPPRPATDVQQALQNVGNKRSFLLGITITALNPTLIVTWVGAVTMLHSLHVVEFNAKHALPFSIGAWTGICAWFTVLSLLLARFKDRFPRSTLDAAVRAMGVLLTALGLWLGVRFFVYLHAAH